MRGSVPTFACRESENKPQYTRPRLPVIVSLVYCETSALDLAATEVGLLVLDLLAVVRNEA
uniref:Uncharacterized protein n=1 Tax=Timema douglasi TaxID=61478 RepID=A0A7R8VWX2_TIMDO|nr:unnamed protein product [Timema douglasi]